MVVKFGEIMFFTSHVEDHCEQGQFVRIVVFSTEQDRQRVQLSDNPILDNPPPSMADQNDPPTSIPTAAPGSTAPSGTISNNNNNDLHTCTNLVLDLIVREDVNDPDLLAY